MVALRGLINAVVTPFRDDESLDVAGFQRLVDLAIAEGIQGVVVAGCTGEPWALSDEERATLFRAGVEAAQGRVPVIGGAAGVHAREAIARVRLAENAGCDAVMVQQPWYAVPGQEEIYKYFRQVADASALPVMLYNIPRRTGISISPDVVDRLADHPNVVAIKESSKDWAVLSEIIRRCKDRIDVLVGYADTLGLAAMAEGSTGTVEAVFPALMGPAYRRFIDAGVSGDMATARKLQADFARWHRELWGIGTFPASLKAAINLIGRPGGRPRPPIDPLNVAQTEQVAQALSRMGLLPARRAVA